MLKLIQIHKYNEDLAIDRENHYSNPKGFVGRSICYAIKYNEIYYGSIVGGSCTKYLPGRNEFFDNIYGGWWPNNSIINNIFYHIEPKNSKYPIRNFAQKVLNEFQNQIYTDWFLKYGNIVLGFETLVELPRTGEIYKRNGFIEVGITKGYTCKRIADKDNTGTDSWSGKRVWDIVNLRPKRVFCKKAKIPNMCS